MNDVLEVFPVLLAAPFESWLHAALAYYGLALGRWLLVLWAIR